MKTCYILSNNFKFRASRMEVLNSYSKKRGLYRNEQLKWGVFFFNALFLQRWGRSKVEMMMWFVLHLMDRYINDQC
jgi:hypothetical protein